MNGGKLKCPEDGAIPLFVIRHDDINMAYGAILKARSDGVNYKVRKIIHWSVDENGEELLCDPEHHAMLQPVCKRDGGYYRLWLKMFPSHELMIQVRGNNAYALKAFNDDGYSKHYNVQEIRVETSFCPQLTFVCWYDGKRFNKNVTVDAADVARVVQQLS